MPRVRVMWQQSWHVDAACDIASESRPLRATFACAAMAMGRSARPCAMLNPAAKASVTYLSVAAPAWVSLSAGARRWAAGRWMRRWRSRRRRRRACAAASASSQSVCWTHRENSWRNLKSDNFSCFLVSFHSLPHPDVDPNVRSPSLRTPTKPPMFAQGLRRALLLWGSLKESCQPDQPSLSSTSKSLFWKPKISNQQF